MLKDEGRVPAQYDKSVNNPACEGVYYWLLERFDIKGGRTSTVNIFITDEFEMQKGSGSEDPDEYFANRIRFTRTIKTFESMLDGHLFSMWAKQHLSRAWKAGYLIGAFLIRKSSSWCEETRQARNGPRDLIGRYQTWTEGMGLIDWFSCKRKTSSPLFGRL